MTGAIERVQRRAMRIIFPGVSYEISLERCGLSTLSARRAVLCDRLFDILSLPSHKLNYMLPGKHNATYNTRHKRTFILPRMHIDRYRKSFIPAMSISMGISMGISLFMSRMSVS